MKATLFKLPWANQLPDGWRADRLKDLVKKIGSGITPSGGSATYLSEGIPLLRSQNVHFDGLRMDDVAYISDDVHASMSNSQVASNDVLLNITGASIGRCNIVPPDFGEANVNQHVCIVRPRHEGEPRFVRYVLTSPIGQDQVFTSFTGASREGLNFRDLGQFLLPLPPIDEQERIADYLDASCEAIDRAVETKQKQLDTLDALRKSIIQKAVTQGLDPNVPMKDSGVQYLGKVPSIWRIKKLCRLLAEPMTYGLNEPGTDDNPENPRYIRITDFGSDGQLRDETFRSLPPEVARGASLQEGDLLFARSGATVGKSFLFTGYEGEACYAGYLIKANTLRHLLDPRFLYAFTKSLSYESWKDLIFTQATIQNISATKYAYLEIPLPTLEEQQSILEYLDQRLRHQQSVVTTIQNQIDTLNAYRKSLIHECVTGKRRISEDDVAKVKSHV